MLVTATRHAWTGMVCAMACVLAAAIWTPTRTAAQTPSATFPFESVLAMVEQKADPIIAMDNRVEWAGPPRVEVFPRAVGSWNHEVIMRLNLNEEGGSHRVTVDVGVSFSCENKRATAHLMEVNTDVDLNWLEDIFAGDVSVGREPFENFVVELNGLLAAIQEECADIRAWPEGLVIFPGDFLGAYTSDSNASICTDGTSGRTGRVWIENGLIFAEILPATMELRWPNSGPALQLWVSPDGGDPGSHQYWYAPDQNQLEEGGLGNIPVGGGGWASYPVPDGLPFAGCVIIW